jgi:outer membrane protein assembly factor BamB
VREFDRADGFLKWATAPQGAVESSPVILPNGSIFVCSVDGSRYLLDRDGILIWSSVDFRGAIESSPAGANGLLFVGFGDGTLGASDTQGRIVGLTPTGAAVNSSPAVANGVVYVGSNDGKLYAFGAA